MCDTGKLEGGVLNPFKGVEVCPVLGTSDRGKKKA